MMYINIKNATLVILCLISLTGNALFAGPCFSKPKPIFTSQYTEDRDGYRYTFHYVEYSDGTKKQYESREPLPVAQPPVSGAPAMRLTAAQILAGQHPMPMPATQYMVNPPAPIMQSSIPVGQPVLLMPMPLQPMPMAPMHIVPPHLAPSSSSSSSSSGVPQQQAPLPGSLSLSRISENSDEGGRVSEFIQQDSSDNSPSSATPSKKDSNESKGQRRASRSSQTS